MTTVNSISCGQSSSFMALHFEADHNLFACVEQEVYKYTFETRKAREGVTGLSQAQNWLRLYHPGFWCSAEDDKTLVVAHSLSNEIGKSKGIYCRTGHGGIDVVFAHNWGRTKYKTYDDIVKDYLPNSTKRLCTEVLKVEPIYNYVRNRISKVEPVEMRIGFRLDELDRTVNLFFKLVEIKKRIPNPDFDLQKVIDEYKIPHYLVNWWDAMDVEKMVKSGQRILKSQPFNYYKDDYYRIPSFPLIQHGITKADVVKYWSGRPEYEFPKISNCAMCFHHTVRQLQDQWNNPTNHFRMQWAADAEIAKGKTFKRRLVRGRNLPTSMEYIKNLPLQLEIDFFDLASCDSGSCTD